MLDKLKSRKLIATLALAVLVVLNRKLALGLDATDLGTIAGTVAAYCVGQGLVDAKAEPAKAQAQQTMVNVQP